MVATCGSFVNFLDLQCIFVNIFAGSPLIFGIISLLVIAVVGATFRMITPVLGVVALIFAIWFAPFLGPLYYVVLVFGILLLVGGIVRYFIRSG